MTTLLLLIACAGPPDAGPPDIGPPDAGPPDIGPPEGGNAGVAAKEAGASRSRAAIPLTGNSELKLATVRQGRDVLGRRDAYIQALQPLERQIRLRSEGPVSTQEFLEHAQNQVLPWEEEQRERLLSIAASLAERLAGLDLPLPKDVLLVQTTGEEESGAAYTRGNAIVLPRRRLAANDAALQRLLAHELFHVISRHDAGLRRELYEIIGFHPCEPIPLPDELKAVKITNPDAPALDSRITIEHNGEMLNVIPILLSDRDEFDPRRKRLFDYLQFRLLAVHRQNGAWQPLLSDGQPILIEGRSSASYREKIGRNTNYIIHPDEILADNFVHLVMGTKDLPSPKIVEQMRAVLTSEKQLPTHGDVEERRNE